MAKWRSLLPAQKSFFYFSYWGSVTKGSPTNAQRYYWGSVAGGYRSLQSCCVLLRTEWGMTQNQKYLCIKKRVTCTHL